MKTLHQRIRQCEDSVELAISALNHLPRLEHLSMDVPDTALKPHLSVQCIESEEEAIRRIFLEGLTSATRASLKSLKVWSHYYDEVSFQGLTNLEVLKIYFNHSKMSAHTLFDSLCRHDFPRLHTLTISGNSIRFRTPPVIQQLLDSILHGGMQNVRSLTLDSMSLIDYFAETLIQVMPHLDFLGLCNNKLSLDCKRRLTAASLQFACTVQYYW